MDDLTGLGKIADSKLANRVYEDGLSGLTQEGGKALTDIAKAFRLFTSPIQLLAAAQDRLAIYCEKVRAGVPEERHVEAAPSIAAPVLLELRYMEEDNPLTTLYINLLKRAIDRERVNEAHPAFIKIINQLSPDEALVLHYLKDSELRTVEYRFIEEPDYPVHSIAECNIPIECLTYPAYLPMYLEHLDNLGLVNYFTGALCDQSKYPPLVPNIVADNWTAKLTSFGRLFVQACEP